MWLVSVSEWSLPLNRGGIKTSVGEYSISAVGPGPRAAKHWALAKDAGLKTVAKVQLNNTWELSAVPYLPQVFLCGALLSWLTARVSALNWEVAGTIPPRGLE